MVTTLTTSHCLPEYDVDDPKCKRPRFSWTGDVAFSGYSELICCRGRIGRFAETIKRVWREAPTEQKAGAVTKPLLARLAERDDYREIVASVIEDVESLLGLAVTRAASLRRSLRASLQEDPGS